MDARAKAGVVGELGAGTQAYCGSCGLHLEAQPELPTRAEWEAGTRQPAEPPPPAPPAEPPPTADAPLRICPECSAQARTRDENCPYCGASYLRHRRTRARRRFAAMARRTKVLIGGAILLSLLGGARIAIALKVKHDNDLEAQHEAAQAAAQAAQQARQQRRQQERQERQILVTDMEKAITRYAERQSLQRYSLINGPILRTECDPSGGHIDTQSSTQDFSCLAVRNESGGTLHGYRFSATANYDRSSYSWRLGG